MAARALFRSVARRILPGGGARSGFFPPPPPTNEILNPSRGDPLMAGMASGAALRSLATKLSRAPPAPPQRIYQRRLHSNFNSSSSSSSGDSILDAMAKARAGVAYVTLFGSVIYMHGWILPRLESLEKKLKARKDLNDCLTQATEAFEGLQAILDAPAPTDVSPVQSSSGEENGNSTKDVSGNRSMESKSTMDYDAKIAMLEQLDATIAMLEELEAHLTKLQDAL